MPDVRASPRATAAQGTEAYRCRGGRLHEYQPPRPARPWQGAPPSAAGPGAAGRGQPRSSDHRAALKPGVARPSASHQLLSPGSTDSTRRRPQQERRSIPISSVLRSLRCPHRVPARLRPPRSHHPLGRRCVSPARWRPSRKVARSTRDRRQPPGPGRRGALYGRPRGVEVDVGRGGNITRPSIRCAGRQLFTPEGEMLSVPGLQVPWPASSLPQSPSSTGPGVGRGERGREREGGRRARVPLT